MEKDDSGWINFNRDELEILFFQFASLIRFTPDHDKDSGTERIRLYNNMLNQLPDHLASDLRVVVSAKMESMDEVIKSYGIDPTNQDEVRNIAATVLANSIKPEPEYQKECTREDLHEFTPEELRLLGLDESLPEEPEDPAFE